MPHKKVLLVDDSSVSLMMEEMILKKRTRYNIVTARNGSEAVQKVHSERPDMVLMDVCMPVMDGFEACRTLRGKAETRDLPVVLVTTRGEPEHVEQGFQCGCTDYITKPINSTELVNLLRNYLGE